MRPKKLAPLSQLVAEAECLGQGREWKSALYGKVKAFVYGAKARCTKPHHPSYRNYGGRGIQFRLKTADEVIAAIGLPPSSKHSVDRIDVNGHYEAGNIRWATQLEQMANVNHNVFVEIEGVQYKRVDLVKKYGVSADSIDYRSKRGWPFEKVVSQEKQYDTSSLSLAVKAASKKRGDRTHCKRDHPLSGSNLYQFRGSRHCKTCRASWSKEGA